MCRLSWFLDPGGWSKAAAVGLYFIFPGICTLSLNNLQMEFLDHAKQSSKDWFRIEVQAQEQHHLKINCPKCRFYVFLVLFCYGLVSIQVLSDTLIVPEEQWEVNPNSHAVNDIIIILPVDKATWRLCTFSPTVVTFCFLSLCLTELAVSPGAYFTLQKWFPHTASTRAHLCSSICRHVLHGLPGSPTSSLHGGLVSPSSCCLALDSSSSFPCPALRTIAKLTCLYQGHLGDSYGVIIAFANLQLVFPMAIQPPKWTTNKSCL
ncbi:hypothetical protein STEG23_006730, partial [Scotinomys teguina]